MLNCARIEYIVHYIWSFLGQFVKWIHSIYKNIYIFEIYIYIDM